MNQILTLTWPNSLTEQDRRIDQQIERLFDLSPPEPQQPPLKWGDDDA